MSIDYIISSILITTIIIYYIFYRENFDNYVNNKLELEIRYYKTLIYFTKDEVVKNNMKMFYYNKINAKLVYLMIKNVDPTSFNSLEKHTNRIEICEEILNKLNKDFDIKL